MGILDTLRKALGGEDDGPVEPWMGDDTTVETGGFDQGFEIPEWVSSPLALSLGLQAAGALVKNKAAEDALRRRRALTDAMGTYKMANAREQTGVVNKYLEGETPAARAEQLAEAQSDAKLGYEKSIGAAQAFEHSNEVAGNVSQQFKDAGEASADAEMVRRNKLIANLSALRAPDLSAATRARRYGKAAGDVSGLTTAATNVGGAYGVDMNNVQPNPRVGMVGDVLSGAGQGVALTAALKRLRDI